MNKEPRQKQGLRLEPIHIDDNNWYYEEKGRFCLVHRVVDAKGNYLFTDQIRIPWKKLLESVKRKYDI
ncbi:unnamed protein product [marine sediment metagenome]|uniref:Uncharacterized protein n=1 Tax=marine sediment metagenome TaxID=412755 RepID=X1AVC6_9ZZZZ